jgi:trpB: tryptophan synthase, beta subunit
MSDGRFGIHGGQYIPETLMNEIINLEKQYNYYKTIRSSARSSMTC